MYARRFAGWTVAVLLAGLLGPSEQALADEGEGKDPRRNRVVRVVERAQPAVVSIKTSRLAVTRSWYEFLAPRSGRQFGGRVPKGALGSGAIFHKRGYVITNAHVIQQATDILVQLDRPAGAKPLDVPAVPIAVDLPNDLAILRLIPPAGGPTTFPNIDLGRSNDLRVGETVVAIGHPLGLGLTVTRGIVSAVGRKLSVHKQTFNDFIQVDAAVNEGNSGGPLFDITGRWIGVNTAIYKRGYGSTAEGIGFAIPIDRVRALIARTFKRRLITGTWYGIELEPGEDGEPLVQAVYPKGPAGTSGLEVGDRLVSVGGKPVGSLFDVRLAMAAIPKGGALVVEGTRPGSEGRAAYTIADADLPTTTLSMKHLGFQVDDVDVDGVFVIAVRPDSPASKIGVQRGDLVTALGGFAIRTTDDLLRFLQFVRGGDVIDIALKRPRRTPMGTIGQPLDGVLEAE